MTARVLPRRVLIFVLVFVPGMALVTSLGGGLLVARSADAGPSAMRPSTMNKDQIVRMEGGSAVGPGRNGRLDRNAVAVIGDKAVAYRAWTAFWRTSEPVPSREPGIQELRLSDARILFYAEPERSDQPATAREDAPGTTAISGKEATFRQREGGPPSAHFERDARAVHLLEGGDTLLLTSDALDYSEEPRGGGRGSARVLESDQTVRIECGGSTLDGRGLRAVLERDRRERLHLNRDVSGVFVTGDRTKPGHNVIRLRCDGAADLEALDAPSGRRSDGRQPWRATFREDCVFEDEAMNSILKADEVVVDFVRSSKADQAVGAPSTEILRVFANGHVTIDGKDEASVYHVACDRLRRVAEDGRTDVTVLEGPQTLRFEAAPDPTAPAATAHARIYEVTGKGPTTIRERRELASRDSATKVTIVCENQVVALETDAVTNAPLSEIRAPRITIEGARAAAAAAGSAPADRQRITPSLLRAEQGAELRRQELFAKAATVVWTAARADAREHIALTGTPLLTYPDKEGVNPFDEKGQAKPGQLELAARERIDVDLAPAAAGSKRRSGAHDIACAGGMTARKLVDGVPSIVLTSQRGTAKLDDEGRPLELYAEGDAVLVGHGEGKGARAGNLAGDDIRVLRRAKGLGAAPEPNAQPNRDMDAFARGNDRVPALAVFINGKQRHEVRGRELRSVEGGAVLQAIGHATADIDAPADTGPASRSVRPTSPAVVIEAQELRADIDPAEKGDSGLRTLSADGDVLLRDSTYQLRGTRVTYDVPSGRAEAKGAPARLRRADESWLESPFLRAHFDPKAKGRESFQRGFSPQGGTLVAYHGAPARERVTITGKGPFELQRTFASATEDVVVVFEKQLPNGSWHLDTRLDQARRVDVTFDPEVRGQASEKIRTLVATGGAAPRTGARVSNRSVDKGTASVAIAERIEVAPGASKLYLSSPSGTSRVFVDETSARRRYECDEGTFDYQTHEWTNTTRLVTVLE